MRRIIITSLALLSYNILLLAQQNMTNKEFTNSLQIGDSIHYDFIQTLPWRESMLSKYTWDFSHIEYTEREKKLVVIDKDSLHTKLEDQGKILDFSFINNQVHLQRLQTALLNLEFDNSLVYARYPFVEGDSLVSQINGYGTYSSQNKISLKGMCTTKNVGIGKLILPSNDTLNQACKLEKEINAKIQIFRDSIESKHQGELDYRNITNEWYISGCIFPILKTIDAVLYNGSKTILQEKIAYVATPEQNQTWLVRARDRAETSNYSGEFIGNDAAKSVIKYEVSANGKNIKLKYSVSSDAQLRFVLSNSAGVIYKSISKHQHTGDYQQEFSCAGLPPTEYVLYIYANNQIYSEKVAIK